MTTSSQFNMTAVRKGVFDSSFKSDNLTQNRSSLLAKRPESVLLTGATGFVGAFISHELLKQGITTHCLVRAHSVHKARQRLLSTMQEDNICETRFVSLIKPVVSDVAQPLLGMTDQVFDDLPIR